MCVCVCVRMRVLHARIRKSIIAYAASQMPSDLQLDIYMCECVFTYTHTYSCICMRICLYFCWRKTMQHFHILQAHLRHLISALCQLLLLLCIVSLLFMWWQPPVGCGNILISQVMFYDFFPFYVSRCDVAYFTHTHTCMIVCVCTPSVPHYPVL